MAEVQQANTSIYGNIQAPKQMSLADMLNLSKSSYELNKMKELYPSMIEEQKAKSESAQAQSKITGIELEKSTQANEERKIAQSLFSDPSNYLDKNGNIDVPRITKTVNPVMPYTGAEYIKKYTDLAQNQSTAASAKTRLTDEQRGSLGSLLGGMSAAGIDDPKKYAESVQRWADQHPGDKNIQDLASAYIGNLKYAQPGDQTRLTAAKAAQEYKGPAQQIGANAAGQTVVTNTLTGEQRIPGQPQANPNPTSGGVGALNEYTKNLTNRVESATQVDTRLNELQDLMSKFKPGAGTKTYQEIAQKLQAVGAPQALVDKVAGGDLSAAQSFNKFIAQVVTSSIGSLSDKSTANSINDYIKNNPDINTDERALNRFIGFAKKQNQIPVEEQNFLLNKMKSGSLNPDTHIGEAQQHIREKFLSPTQAESVKENPSSVGGKTVTGNWKGKPVISRDGGKTWELK